LQNYEKIIIYTKIFFTLSLLRASPRWRKLAACAQSALPFGKLQEFAKVFLPLNSKFTIHNSQHYCALPPSPKERGNGGEDFPRWRKLAACAQFTIHNLPILLALFRVHYRLEKLFSLWCIKEISRVIILYYID